MVSSKRVRSGYLVAMEELWRELSRNGGSAVIDGIRDTRDSAERIGLVTSLMVDAIERSSLGNFNGDIYYFGGQIYERMALAQFRNIIYELVIRRMKLPARDIVRFQTVMFRCQDAVMCKELVLDNGIMVFGNGVLDVRTRELHDFDKCFVQVNKVDYEYKPNATTFLWYQFLNEVLPDPLYRNVLQMFLGAIFIDRREAKIEQMMILLGNGANGKSVIQETVKGVLGNENVSEVGLSGLCATGDRGERNVALINGKRLNYCSEIQTNEFGKSSDRLKAMISGEPVQARFLYGNGFKACNLPLMMANANHLPTFRDTSKGMLRRIYVIPFNVEIPEIRQDKTLAIKMQDEYSGILNWILDGRDKFVKEGYKLPDSISIQEIVARDKAAVSLPLRFMLIQGYEPKAGKDVEMEPVNWIPSAQLYAAYSRWCEQNCYEVMSNKQFGITLENNGFQKRRNKTGNEYAVFGEITINTLQRKIEQKKRLEEKAKANNPKTKFVYVDGKTWVGSMKALSEVSAVGLKTITTLNTKGKFDDFKKGDKEHWLYDVEGCMAVMKKEKVLGTDAEKLAHRRMLRELKYMRYVFNQRMAYHGLPYRKYSTSTEQIGGEIVVDDMMTDNEVFDMAHRDLGFDLSKIKKNNAQGPGGRGGKGFTADLPDLTDEEL